MLNPDCPRLDATMLSGWSCCEYFRLAWLEDALSARPTGIKSRKPSIHQEYGSVCHRGFEAFWRGKSYDEAYGDATRRARKVREDYWSPKELQRWNEMNDDLPDVLYAYFNYWGEPGQHKILEDMTPTATAGPVIEWPFELSIGWPRPGGQGFTAFGKFDRVMDSPVRNQEDKTASLIEGLEAYREGMLMRFQFGFYDWALRQMGYNPGPPEICVVKKPYRKTKASVHLVKLPELIVPSVRQRFDEQLKFKVAEIKHWLKTYSNMRSWTLDGGQLCLGAYNEPCEMLKLCAFGMNEVTLKGYEARQ